MNIMEDTTTETINTTNLIKEAMAKQLIQQKE